MARILQCDRCEKIERKPWVVRFGYIGSIERVSANIGSDFDPYGDDALALCNECQDELDELVGKFMDKKKK